MDMKKANLVPTPGVAATKEEHRQYETSLQFSRSDAPAYGGLTTKLNYLAFDWP